MHAKRILIHINHFQGFLHQSKVHVVNTLIFLVSYLHTHLYQKHLDSEVIFN